MENFKRVYALKNLDGETVAVLRLKDKPFGITVSESFVKKPFRNLEYVFYNGGKTCRAKGDGVLSDPSVLGEVCLAVYNGENLAGAPDLLTATKKTERLKNAYSAPIYDDEAIAEENYYLFENENETKNFIYDDVEKKSCGIGKTESGKTEIRSDEASACGIEKSRYKPENEQFRSETRTKGCPLLSQKDSNFLRKDEYEFKKIVCGKPVQKDLTNVLPCSRFYKIGEEEYYLLGAIYQDDEPSCYVYAVPGKTGVAPKGFENAYFVPKDFFSKEDGYYCLFQKRSS